MFYIGDFLISYIFRIFAIKNHSVSSLGSIRTACRSSSLYTVFRPNDLRPGVHHDLVDNPISIGSRTASSWNVKKSEITHSFSSGASVHVEYTRVPPGTNRANATSRSSFWSSAFRVILSSDQNPYVFSLCIDIRPSAEQGASSNIRSNSTSALASTTTILPPVSQRKCRASILTPSIIVAH